MISQPDLLLSLGGSVYIVSLWSQAYKNYVHKSANEISWGFVILTYASLSLFISGKLLIGLYYAATLDLLCGAAVTWIAVQKLKDRGSQ